MNAATLVPYINVKLSLLGAKPAPAESNEFTDLVSSLVSQYREKERLLANHLCPPDQRIQNFLYDYLQNIPARICPCAPWRSTARVWPAFCRSRPIATNSSPAF